MENQFNIEYYTLLAERIQARDADAFTEFYQVSYYDLYRYAYYFLRMRISPRMHCMKFTYWYGAPFLP